MKIHVAIDGSDSALRALSYVISHRDFFSANPDLVLINVHLPLPSVRARTILGSEVVERYYAEEAEAVLAPARAMLAGSRAASPNARPSDSLPRKLSPQPRLMAVT